jgi:type IV fimbrial biogenesis protein FimT
MKTKGFTLVELMVTLVVAGILLTMAIPSFRKTIWNNRLTAQANEFVTALNFARSEAIKRGGRVTICISSNSTESTSTCDPNVNWERGWIIFVDTSTFGTRQTSELILRAHEGLSGGNTLTTGTNFNDFISYLSSGISRGANNLANGTFLLCDSRGTSKARSIVIGPTGRPRTQSGASSCP